MSAVDTLSLLTSLWSGAWMAPALTPAPELVAQGRPLVAVKAIATGLRHTCAILSDSTLWCWGSNASGQLGLGDLQNGSPEPRLVSSLPLVRSVATGWSATCAIDLSDKLWCWGDNYMGLLGVNSTEMVVPAPTHVVKLRKVRSVAMGIGDICALDFEHSLWCWGTQPDGIGTVPSTEPQRVLAGVDRFDLGLHHICAAKFDGSFFCWGLNDHEQIGRHNRTRKVEDTLDFIKAPWLTGIGNVGAFALGGSRTCAEIGGKLECWGDSVKTLDPQRLLSLGDDHSCAVSADGDLRCWGIDPAPGVGRDGLYSPAGSTLPMDLPITSLSSGSGDHTCAIFANGLSRCWGGNTYGQLGHPALTAPVFGIPGDDINDLPFHEFWREGGP